MHSRDSQILYIVDRPSCSKKSSENAMKLINSFQDSIPFTSLSKGRQSGSGDLSKLNGGLGHVLSGKQSIKRGRQSALERLPLGTQSNR